MHASLSPYALARSARDVETQARRGAEAAWHELFTYYYPRVFRLLASRLGEVEAEPLARGVFLDAHARVTRPGRSGSGTDSAAGDSSELTTGHLILRAARDALRHRMVDAAADLSHELGYVLPQYVAPEVRASLATLPPDDRIALELRYLLGLTTSEVAAVLGMRPSALARLVHRAARLLRDAGQEASGLG